MSEAFFERWFPGEWNVDAGFLNAIARVLPENRLEQLPLDHPLYRVHFEVGRVEYSPRAREDFGALDSATLEGVTLDGRLAVVYSRFDLGDGWEQFPHPYSYGYSEKDAMQIGTNLLVYAVTH